MKMSPMSLAFILLVYNILLSAPLHALELVWAAAYLNLECSRVSYNSALRLII